MASTSKRNKYFDNAKFILIFLVVFGHMISPLKNSDGILFTLYTFIYLFHMPAFILISGYFAKGYRKKGNFLKSIKKILVPYILFQVLYSVYYYLSGQESSFHANVLEPHWSLWFLLSLFFWNSLLYLFARLKWFGVILAVAVGIAVGYIDSIGSFLSLSRTFVFFPYFLIGFMINSHQLKRMIQNKFSFSFGLIVMVATITFFRLGFPNDAIHWLLGDRSYAAMGAEQIIGGWYRCLQYIGTLLVIFGFLTCIPTIHFKLTKIGERTLYIYLFHGFIIISLHNLLPSKSLLTISDNYFLLIGISFVITVFLGSYLVKRFTKPIVEPRITVSHREG
ncbi:acyltransferase family protein [Bacillus rubiinfantis]|uniref:acyltransferase family protein n=1 Tax=Bacillus rubiinfantis TaxID=1499680 RepID=UPI0005AB5E81|nr:acyltransferase family protein [Bacillus rubiinfantis]